MDEEKKALENSAQPEFSLEDILKEFGEEEPEQSVQPEEDVQIWQENAPVEEKQNAEVSSDTVRISDVAKAIEQLQAQQDETARFTPVSDETQRFAPISDETMRFTPVAEEKPAPEKRPVVTLPEKAEPYSEKWEPEYEQPIGEYIPQEPIVFRPKSRLREIKRKLVEGPERRYYELAELGLGKLQAAIFLSVLVWLLASGATVMYALGMVPGNRMRLMVFGQVLALLLSTLLGSYQLQEGIASIFRRRFTLNSLLVFSCIACFVDAIVCLKQERVPCSAAFCLNMTMSLWSTYQKRNTEMAQMDTMRKAIRLDSLVSSPDYYEGRPGFLRSEGEVEDFMDHYRQISGPEKTMSVYALSALFVSVVAAAIAGLRFHVHLAVQVFCTSLLVAAPATAFITLSRPAALLQRRLHKHGSVICGWKGVVGLSKAAVFPLTDKDLFPAGAAKLNGLKFYGSRTPDEVVSYASALITADGGTMAPLFGQLLESRSGYHYDAENVRSYVGGIGGEVNGEAVLAGSLSFMQSMGVDMPSGTKVKSAVYVAIDGSLSGVFAVSFTKAKASVAGLTTLCAYRGLTPVLTTGDFMLTESFIRNRFGVNVKRIAFPERAVRQELAAKEPAEDAQTLALTTRDDLAGISYAVTGSRALRSASIIGATIHMIAGILGLLIMLVLAFLGAGYLLTPSNILLYEIIWMIPGLLITHWTRAV